MLPGINPVDGRFSVACAVESDGGGGNSPVYAFARARCRAACRGLIMRKLTGFGTPKGWAAALRGVLHALRDRLRRLTPSRRLWTALDTTRTRQTPPPNKFARAA